MLSPLFLHLIHLKHILDFKFFIYLGETADCWVLGKVKMAKCVGCVLFGGAVMD